MQQKAQHCVRHACTLPVPLHIVPWADQPVADVRQAAWASACTSNVKQTNTSYITVLHRVCTAGSTAGVNAGLLGQQKSKQPGTPIRQPTRGHVFDALPLMRSVSEAAFSAG
jgi:hypothetical protein